MIAVSAGHAAETGERRIRDLNYRDAGQGIAAPRCTLDVCAPAGARNLPVIIWFHGGGLTQGVKEVPEPLRGQGVVIVAPNYRLSPKVKVEQCIDDAAAAVAWTFKHVAQHGGDPGRIVISGHSAGGYLASMVGLDPRWLAKYGIHPKQIAGLAPLSGQMITHFAARKEQGIKPEQPMIDELAPLFHVRKDAPPMLLVTGDRELEMLGRYEENAYFWRMMQVAGHPRTRLVELKGFNHGAMAEPAYPLLLKFVRDLESAGVE
jgi:acetyl esterase/lipase